MDMQRDILAPRDRHVLSDEKKLAAISGFASGLSGFFGAAGALLFNWLVQWWLGREMKLVNGLALFTIFISAATSIAVRSLWPFQAFQVNWHMTHVALVALVCGMIGVFLGKRYEQQLREVHLHYIFVCALILVGVKMIGVAIIPLWLLPHFNWMTIVVLASLVAGVSSPLLGMGAGVFLIPAFTTGLGFTRDEGILMSLVVSAVLMLSGSLLYLKSRQLNRRDIRYVIVPAIIGSPMGVWLSYRFPQKSFQSLFGLLLIVCATKTLYDISAVAHKIVDQGGLLGIRAWRGCVK